MLHPCHVLQHALVEYVRPDAQQPFHQPVLLVGEPQVVEAAVVAVAANHSATAGRESKLGLHELEAAAQRALVHGQGDARPRLGTCQLEEIKDVQVFQWCGWGIGA